MVEAFKFNVAPVHIGLLLVATGLGVTFTTTVVVPRPLGQPETVVTSKYVPDAADVAFGMDGLDKVDEKLLGPVHE